LGHDENRLFQKAEAYCMNASFGTQFAAFMLCKLVSLRYSSVKVIARWPDPARRIFFDKGMQVIPWAS